MKITTFVEVKKSFADILCGIDGQQAKKLSAKLPEWAAVPGIKVPASLALEQCSSSATALYKAALIGKTGTVTDITGGFGVDSWAFSRIADKVFYFERNHELTETVKKNYEALGIRNVTIHCECIDEYSDIPDCDLLFADPARRSDTGRKVFLLEDCTPNILTLLPHIWEHTASVLLKLSPMADISLTAKQLGPQVKEIHVLSHGGEMKEILVLMQRDWNGAYSITASDTIHSLRFTPEEENEARAEYPESISAGQYLFEPDPSILKAGAFKLLAARTGAKKLAKSTHLYLCNAPLAFGKSHRIEEILTFDKRSFAQLKSEYPKAEISAKNLPISSDALRIKMGISQGGNTHIFAFSATVGGNDCRLFVTSKDI